jgi:hypothetical protein
MSDQEIFEFLNDVAVKEIKAVAKEWGTRLGWAPEKAEANTRAWLHRIRVKVLKDQTFLNTIYAIQKKSPRVRKFTLSGALPDSLDDLE